MDTTRTALQLDNDAYSPASHMALQHLKAAGVPSPDLKLRQIYAQICPEVSEAAAEMETFAEDFQEVMRKKVYLKMIASECADDPIEYARKYDAGLTEAGRMKEGGSNYQLSVGLLTKFDPVSFDGFLQRSGGLPEYIHQLAYDTALEMAKKYLLEKSKGNLQ